jgi:hypothetical protein
LRTDFLGLGLNKGHAPEGLKKDSIFPGRWVFGRFLAFHGEILICLVDDPREAGVLSDNPASKLPASVIRNLKLILFCSQNVLFLSVISLFP